MEPSNWLVEVRDVAEGPYLPGAHARATGFCDALLALDRADGSDTLSVVIDGAKATDMLKDAPESGAELVFLEAEKRPVFMWCGMRWTAASGA